MEILRPPALRDAIILMGVWTVIGGNNMLLYLAALSNVPQDLYEAAEIDGGVVEEILERHLAAARADDLFHRRDERDRRLQGGFGRPRILTQGKPANTTVTLAYYIYQKGFEQFQMGYASAIAWILFLMVFGFTLLYLWPRPGKSLGY